MKRIVDFKLDNGDDFRKVLSNVIVMREKVSHRKIANFCSSRILQTFDLDYHQNDKTKHFWKISKGNLIRLVKPVVKG